VDLVELWPHAECILKASCQDWRPRRFRAKNAKYRKGRKEFEGEEERFAVLGDLGVKSSSSPSIDGVSDPADASGRDPAADEAAALPLGDERALTGMVGVEAHGREIGWVAV